MSTSPAKSNGDAPKLSDELIELPPNPYLDFGLRLGRDEITAWILSTGATFAVSAWFLVLALGIVSAGACASILAVVGTIAEKPGLLFFYFIDAFREYRATSSGNRNSLSCYVKKIFRAGWQTLRADLLYHDPAYTILLYLLLRMTSSQSVAVATLLCVVSFVAAIL